MFPITIVSRLYEKRALIWQFTKRNVELKHKGSYLGVLWLVLNPLMQMAVYTVVFGVIFGGMKSSSGYHYALSIFLGLTIFQLISECISVTPAVIVAHPNFVKKVVFPLEVLPVATILAAVYHFCICLILVFVGMLVVGDGVSIGALCFPVVVLPIVLMAFGLAWLLSSLGVFFRDIQQVAGPTSLVIMYASGIFYSTAMVKGKASHIWSFLQFNPLIHVIEQSRNSLILHAPIEWSGILYAYAFGILVFCLGFYCFEKLKPLFADVL